VALALVVLAVAIGGLWWIFGRGSSDAVRLSLVVPQEGAMVFRVHNSAGANADSVGAFEFDSEFDGILTLRTRSVDGDVARVAGLLDISRLIWNGRPETGRPTLRARFQLRSDGNVVAGRSFNPGVPAGTYDPLVAGLSPDLPPHPVKLGDSWGDGYQFQDQGVEVQVTTSSRFLRVEELDGVMVVVVQGTRTLDLSTARQRKRDVTGTITVNQTAWIDPVLGKVLRMSATISGTITESGRGGTARAQAIERLELTAL
jgi:hypothetical protein